MTEQKKDTRFASLEAIPRHTAVPSGVRRMVSLLYIDRRRTLPAVAGLVAFAAGFVAFAPALYEGVATSAVFETQKPSSFQLRAPSSAPSVHATAMIEKVPQEEQLEPTEKLDKTADPDPASAVEVAAKPAMPPVVVARQGVEANASIQHPPRKIIPVAEAMSLYDGRATAEPPKVTEPAASVRPFFAEGLASEEETLAFFRGSPDLRGEEASEVDTKQLRQAENDLSPAIALPESVPAPVARPAATSARVEFRIEQGTGVQSGFVLYNKDDANLRRYFVVAKAFRDGKSVPWSFKDVADGKDVSTDKFAIEVSEKAFRGLSEEKKKFGKVVHDVLGTMSDDRARIEWAIESNGNMLAAPEGRG